MELNCCKEPKSVANIHITFFCGLLKDCCGIFALGDFTSQTNIPLKGSWAGRVDASFLLTHFLSDLRNFWWERFDAPIRMVLLKLNLRKSVSVAESANPWHSKLDFHKERWNCICLYMVFFQVSHHSLPEKGWSGFGRYLRGSRASGWLTISE